MDAQQESKGRATTFAIAKFEEQKIYEKLTI